MRYRYIYKYKTGLTKVKTRLAIAITILGLGASGIVGSIAAFGSASAITPEVVYDSLPSVSTPTNYPSQPFQAQQTFEFGDSIHLGGTARTLNTVTVGMSDWALASTPANQAWCASVAGTCTTDGFTWPITVNVYSTHLDANGAPDQLLATTTQNISIPWRPATPVCTTDSTAWTDGTNCYHGLAFNATFDLSSHQVVLPNDVIVSVAYNTQTWGANPTGVDGPYNSLNVSIPDNQIVSTGSDANPSGVFWNTHTCAWYTAGSNAANQCNAQNYGLYEEDGFGINGTVALQITATPALPTSKDQCMKNGWQSFGTTFKNQGDCVSFVATGGKNQPSGPAKH